MSVVSKYRRFTAKLDGRTRAGRAVKELSAAFLRDIENPAAITSLELKAIGRAAELLALAGEARTSALRNGSLDLASVVRIENAAERALRALGSIKVKPRSQSLMDRIVALRPSQSD